jgi:hypothetical protein
MLQGMIARFAEQAPVAVMVRGLLANILSPSEIDTIFRETAVRQHEDELLFSSVVELLQLVVTKSHKSLRAAYQAHHEQFEVSLTSVYNKLNGVETQVSRALVQRTAQRMGQVMEAFRGPPTKFLGRYRRRILDGSHLAATEHRLKELRTLHGGPLPGQALVVLDPEWGLATDMIPCEDGHAQERSLLVDLLDMVEPDDLWIADRNFCTVLMLHQIAASKAYFLVRQHAGLPWEPRGERRRVGRSQTGWVYEQQGVVPDGMGNDLPVRRLTLELDEATTEGERTIHMLTNLPSSVKGTDAADEYHGRWDIERLFGELTLSLRGEINTLAYPGAALLGYAVALLTYNVLSVVKAALRVTHGPELIDKDLSIYYLADEVAGVWRGMEVAVPNAIWKRTFSRLETVDLAEELISIAGHANVKRYPKSPRGPKRPAPKRHGKKPHISTARVLAQCRKR